jgi:hypothetical protein
MIILDSEAQMECARLDQAIRRAEFKLKLWRRLENVPSACLTAILRRSEVEVELRGLRKDRERLLNRR